jgi:hypothetical protein
MDESDYSEFVAGALKRSRKRRPRNPPVLMPDRDNPLMVDPDGLPIVEEYTCLEEDEEEAKEYEAMIQNRNHKCVYCEHGSCKEYANGELERIHDSHEENYGRISDRQSFRMIAEEYNKKIYQPNLRFNTSEAKRKGGEIQKPPE